VAVIKHAHHNVEIDKPGKDSYRLRKSGADQMIISTNERVAYIKETPAQAMSFDETVAMLDHSLIDLVLIEGFKNENYDKIELYRASQNKPLLYTSNDRVCAIAHDGLSPDDQKLIKQTNITELDLNNIEQVAQFVLQYVTTKT
jgi:molybdopterin molybdotransferase